MTEKSLSWHVWAMRIVLLLAFLLASYLTWVSLGVDPIGGCSGSEIFDCEHVLASPWSKWLGIPVASLAALTYAVLLIWSFWLVSALRVRLFVATLSFCIVGAAVWFLALQFIWLESWCLYCIASHVCGILFCGLFWYQEKKVPPVTAALFALPFLLVFIGVQIVLPPATVRIEEVVSTTKSDQEQGEYLVLGQQKLKLALDDVLIWGDPKSPQLMVKFFDYTCKHCRHLHHKISKLHKEFPDLTVVYVPVPLSPACNRYISLEARAGKGACTLAKLAWITWQQQPELFVHYNNWAMRNINEVPSKQEAIDFVKELVPDLAVEEKLQQKSVQQKIQREIELFVELKTRAILPQLIIGQKRLSGSISLEMLRETCREQWQSEQQAAPISLLGDKAKIEPQDFPSLGSSEPSQQIVKLFDYTCSHCRKMHDNLEAILASQSSLRVTLIPVPLHSGCNKYVQASHATKYYACVFAQLTWSVWLADPKLFPSFHRWLMAKERTEKQAKDKAQELLGKEKYQKHYGSWEMSKKMIQSIQIYGDLGGGALPQLFFGNKRTFGEVSTGKLEELLKETKR